MKRIVIVAATAATLLAGQGGAATITSTTVSPTSGGMLPAAVSSVGGVVLDLIGLNGARVVAQQAASSLFEGFPAAADYPLTIGTQTGFSPTILDTLGGGLSQLAARVTLFDGDTAPGDFDDGDNQFTINGTSIGNLSDISTFETDGDGTVIGGAMSGFANETLNTGFFFTADAGMLAAIFASLEASGAATYQIADIDPGDQFYDFTQGLDASVIDTGTGPVVTPPNPDPTPAVPVPAALPLLLAGLGAFGLARRRRAA